MPVRPLDSDVMRWPDANAVHAAAAEWASDVSAGHEDVLAVGYFGSYARGDWGVGSDLDIVIIVHETDTLFENRSLRFGPPALPVPVDVLIYTSAEWKVVSREGMRRPAREMVWLHPNGGEFLEY